MDDVEPVRLPPSPLGGHGALVGGLLVLALLVVLLKPWGADPDGASGRAVIATATPSPSPTLTESLRSDNGYGDVGYDPSIFGIAPPAARWGIWPVGYLVTFGFVAQVPDAQPAASAVLPSPRATAPVTRPSASEIAGASPGASPDVPAPDAGPADGGPAWPSRFDVPDGTHLLLVGINMPVGFGLRSSSLDRLAGDGTWSSVELERYPPPWPEHFAVVGLPRRATDGHLEPWPGGHYRLTLAFDPTGISRSIDIVVTERSPTP
jgi:hypothetical protein